MSDPLLDSLRRWFEIVERQAIDPDSFSAFEVWLHAQQILGLADQQRELPPSAVQVLSEIGQRIGLAVGAPPAAIGAALEEAFGPCPYGPEALDKLTTYLRSQLNAFSTVVPRKGPSLSGEEKPGPPHRFVVKKLWGD